MVGGAVVGGLTLSPASWVPGTIAAPPEVLVLGVLSGLAYGLLAVGIVLAYRASRVLNLAHGQVGAFAAVLLAIMVQRGGVPYWIAFVAALSVGALTAATVELTVVRRLSRGPPLMTLVATLGVAQFLLFVTAAIGSGLAPGRQVPQPAGLPSLDLGALTLTPASFALLGLGPSAVMGLAVLLRRTPLGVAMRASAANPEGARALGIEAGTLQTLSWALAGALAALTAMLVLPAGGAPDTQTLGPSLLLRALAAGAVAGMTNLPVALLAGIALGVVEQLAIWNAPDGRLPDLVLFLVILVALLVRPATGGRRAAREDWTALARWTRLPAAARAVPLVRWSAPALAVVVFVVAALAPLVLGAADEVTLTVLVCYAVVGVSVWVATALTGQLSLGQFALAGVGAMFAAGIAGATGSPALGLLAAPVAGAAVAVLVGLPAVRLPGLMAAVTTLGFALAAEGWLFGQPWALGNGVELDKLVLGPVGFDSTAGGYLISLVALAACLVVTANLARGGFGRRARAVRDNEPVARTFGVPAALVRLQAFAVGGALAALGGALLAQALFRVTPSTFAATESIDVVAMAVLGGLAIAGGPVIGALYIVGLPAFVDLSSAALAATALGWLALVLAVPGGLAAVVEPMRRHGVGFLLRLAGHDPQVAHSGALVTRADPWRTRAALTTKGARPAAGSPAQPALMLDGLVRHYGGVRAVDGISLSVAEGEAVGLVGPNGAGKTSLLDLACGLERPTAGRVLLSGEDITTLSPEGRAARGLVRTFQETVLFPTLTVLEVVALGLERRRPTRLLPAAGGWPRAERAKQARARELVAALGLEPFADNPVHTLSAGTRRVAELACVLALEPRVLLLDEPSGGLAQPEAEALAALLARVHVELGAAMVVIEHDLRLVAGLADRIVVIAAGRVVADGPAAAVISGWAGRESPGRESSVQAARGVPIGSLVAERTP